MSSAVVVGSGPNGLACAAVLARAGVRVHVLEAADGVGGGARSGELTLPGLLHDHCSAVHPMGAGSPVFRALELERHGLEWSWPEVDCAHPLDGGDAALLVRDIDATARGLGADGTVWERIFGAPARAFPALLEDLLQPVLHLPRHPLALARFGLPAALPASVLARAFEGERARALFGGVAAHLIARLDRPMSASVAMALICAGHAFGWPVARGGSQAIADALVADLREHGGSVETGTRVTALGELAGADAVVLDLAPRGALRLAGDRLPVLVRRAYRRFRHGPAAFKVDLAVHGGVPWTNPDTRRAGTVHVGGSFAEIAAAERDVGAGRMPRRPFVLVAQQHVADPGRGDGDLQPVWAYAHVPHGHPYDVTDAVIDHIERFAPGLRERIAAIATRSPADLERVNANYVGGDIVAGANTPWQTLMRPRPALDPYDTGIPGVFLCSASTPPGGGVHGMCGANAARSVLAQLERGGSFAG